MYLNPIRPAVAILAAAALAATLSTGCNDSTETSPTILPGAPFSQTDLIVGTGATAVSGNTLTVNYTGWIYDPTAAENKGRQFDSSNGTPITFQLGAGRVILGWDQGLPGMKVGGKRRLVIPPDLAYGSTGAGNGVVPPYATLVFDVDLVSLR